MRKPNGRMLWQNDRIVAIATGLGRKSQNTKTGGMVQVYILAKEQNPLDAVRSGLDRLICGDCKHRSQDGGFQGRTCYVNVGQGPRSVWAAWKRNRYPMAQSSEYSELFSGKVVRWGAYGDPAMIPTRVDGER